MGCIVTVWGQMLTQATLFPHARHKLVLQAQIFAAIGILLHAMIWRRSSGTERVVIAIMFAVNLWTISRAGF